MRRSPGWAALVVVAAQAPMLLYAPLAVLDHEEQFTPTMAGFWGYVPWAERGDLQANTYCFGCSVDTALAWSIFQVLPQRVWVWKLVPALFLALLAAGGFRGLRDAVGLRAAWVWIALLVFPPMTFGHQLWTPWGGHVEGGAIAVAAVSFALGRASRRGWLAAGFGLGLAVVYTLGQAVTAVGLVLGAAAIGRWREAALMVVGGALAAPLVGGVLCLHPDAISGLEAFLAFHGRGEGPWAAIVNLLTPDALALVWGPAFGAGVAGALVAGAVAWAALAVARGGGDERIWLGAVVAWLVGYAASPAHIDATLPEVREARYAAPLVVAGLLLLAAAIGRRWPSPGARTALVVVLGIGAWGRVASLSPSAPSWVLWVQDAADLPEALSKGDDYQFAMLDRAVCPPGEDLCARWAELRDGFRWWDGEATTWAFPPPGRSSLWEAGYETRIYDRCLLGVGDERLPGCDAVPRWYVEAIRHRFRHHDRRPPARVDAERLLPTLPDARARLQYLRTSGRSYGAFLGPLAPNPPCGLAQSELDALREGLAAGISERWHLDAPAVAARIVERCVVP